MKIKHLLFVLFAIGLLSCEKEVSMEDQIMGTWYMPQALNRHTAGQSVDDVAGHSLNAWNYSMVITTNSDQELVDRTANAIGSITVSGDSEAEINFMRGWYDQNSGQASISFTNYNWYNVHETDQSTYVYGYVDNYSHEYQDSVNIWYNDSTGAYDTMGGWWHSDFISVYNSNNDYYEIREEIDFTFDGITLTIPSQTIGDTNSITIGGEMTHATIHIPANTPTEIFSYTGDTSWDFGSWAIHIEDDGRWVEVFTWEGQYDSSDVYHTYTDSTVAEWELDGDTLFVTYRYDDVWTGDGPGAGQGTWMYQIAYTYTLENGMLKLTNEYDLCQGDAHCHEWVEWEFGLDHGSLEEYKMVWALEFTKTPSARSREFRGPFRTVMGKFPPYKFMK